MYDKELFFKKVALSVYNTLKDILGILFLFREESSDEDLLTVMGDSLEFFEYIDSVNPDALLEVQGISDKSKL